MKNLFQHIKTCSIRGILTIIPLTLTVLMINLVYVFIDKRIMELVDQFIGFRIPGFGLFLFILCLYLTGLVASNVIGKKIFKMLDDLTSKIPVIDTIYQVGMQLSNTLSLPEKQVFKKAVLVDYFKPGVRVIGFVTGTLTDEKDSELLKVFVPTAPNPTSGLLIIISEQQTIDPHWSVEEAMKMVISGGIIGPEQIGISCSDRLSR